MVLGNFEKKIGPMLALIGPKKIGTPYQKSADALKVVFTQVSYISQQKKVSTISHVRQTEGLTISIKELNSFND